MYETVKVSEFPTLRLLNLVNEVFEDYPLHVEWDLFSFNQDVRENSISLSDSYVFLKDDRPVGFILCCVRRSRGRIDSMGVIKEERGKGLGGKMLSFALDVLRNRGVSSVVLEVLASQEEVVKFYSKFGFRVTRRLVSMIKNVPNPRPSIRFLKTERESIHKSALEAMVRLSRRPNWQREPLTLLLSGDRYKMARVGQRLAGYVVWGKGEENAFIVDCSPINDESIYAELLEQAVNYVCQVEERSVCFVGNVPEDDPLYRAAEQAGFQPLFEQYEMLLQL
ncbi:GCN5 family acetyltransferase [Pseudothermotoga hypogea DSM 11164 = NBRC 106472]|uniref:GCN5 family acetyltransferase n=1 Tax=Pseudothermotoga hypogea DSM 11164 = NBRC 106472 TaxID=1123384 RepID=A0A0X1KQ97_9THEM|nr:MULTISPECIES: GNAT family N-acetyltransferase [Pseudothermotoga]AJC73432.1 GCN5 family acetyltransferase [Pseudothermotoga hypogea DSM 11164 = NBRC 106472]MDI6863698.1 GNAT family N-acetyltransferase [Pseudothermotoga sp.]